MQQQSVGLSDEQREQFERDGYLVFDPEIPTDVIDGIVSELDDKYIFEGGEQTDELGVSYTGHQNPRIKNAWKISEGVKQVVLAPKVLGVLQALYGRKPLPFQTLNFPVGTEQSPHSDAMHFNSDPLGFICGVWVALEDTDMENGPLTYFPGSHQLPLPTWDEIGDPDQSEFENYGAFMTERNRRYEHHVAKQIEQHNLNAEYATIRKGQALIWSANLIHGGSPRRDRSRTRHSQVNHYFFEGFRYLTPMRTERDHVFWDYPAWISWEAPRQITPSVVRETISANVPAGATVLVAAERSRELLNIEGRTAWHYPQTADGKSLHCAQLPGRQSAEGATDGEDAVELLERLRAKGAEYLVFPGTKAWWLENHLTELQHHLEERYRAVLRDGGTCVIYAL